MQGMTDFLFEWIVDVNARHAWDIDNVKQYRDIATAFGSVQGALVLLFQSVTGGVDWAVVYELNYEFVLRLLSFQGWLYQLPRPRSSIWTLFKRFPSGLMKVAPSGSFES